MKIDPNNDYKKYFDKISPDSRLIEDTKKKMMEELNSTVYKEKNHIVVYKRIAAAAACFAIVGSAVVMVPKLKNVPVSTNNNSAIQIEQKETSSVTISSEAEKSSSVSSKEKESASNKSSTESVVTSADKNSVKPVSVSVTEAPVNNKQQVISSKETVNKTIPSDKPNSESKAVSVPEAPVSSAVTEKVIIDETKPGSSDGDDTRFHGIGGSDAALPSEDGLNSDTNEETIVCKQIGNKNYNINLISSAVFYSHIVEQKEKVKSEYFKKSDGQDTIVSKIEGMASGCGFDDKAVIPLNFILSDDSNDISLECTSNDLIFEFNPSNSSAGGEKYISFAVSKKGDVGYKMKPKGKLCATELNEIDNSIFSESNNEGVYIGVISSNECYCVAFDFDGLKYRVLFNGYEFEDVLNYIQTFILTLTEQ